MQFCNSDVRNSGSLTTIKLYPGYQWISDLWNFVVDDFTPIKQLVDFNWGVQ